MTILLTGAAGFIGFHVARCLLDAGQTVVGLNNFNSYYDVRLKEARWAHLEKARGFTGRRLEIADNGPGISAADRDKLFMPYYSTKQRGSGLGLAIVRRIIVEHGGSIEVHDNRPAGTRFVIELPL
jgi:nitrogen-specific signal transduction histidine kinase